LPFGCASLLDTLALWIRFALRMLVTLCFGIGFACWYFGHASLWYFGIAL